MKYAIIGFGVEGQANFIYFANLPATTDVIVYDQKPELQIPEIAGVLVQIVHDLKQIPDDYILVRSPGFNLNSLRRVLPNHKIWSGTNEFFRHCTCPIIGVTGTKGKGTTASIITSILRASGRTVHLLGNIGTPALSLLSKIHPQDVVVYELSSFQLWDLQYSPHIAVLTNFEPDHLNVHSSYQEYIQAKVNIVHFGKNCDYVVYNKTDSQVTAVTQAEVGNTGAVAVAYPDADSNVMCQLASTTPLIGEHNLLNTQAAILAALLLLAPEVIETGGELDSNIIESVRIGISNFTGLDHRLQFVAQVDGVDYYDDSISTTPESALAALKSFDRPKLLILGGQDKGGDYSKLVAEVMDYRNRLQVQHIFFVGDNRNALYQLFQGQAGEGTPQLQVLDTTDMVTIVQRVHRAAKRGDVAILSPAAASMDMFRDYKDRGDQFVTAVRGLRSSYSVHGYSTHGFRCMRSSGVRSYCTHGLRSGRGSEVRSCCGQWLRRRRSSGVHGVRCAGLRSRKRKHLQSNHTTSLSSPCVATADRLLLQGLRSRKHQQWHITHTSPISSPCVATTDGLLVRTLPLRKRKSVCSKPSFTLHSLHVLPEDELLVHTLRSRKHPHSNRRTSSPLVQSNVQSNTQVQQAHKYSNVHSNIGIFDSGRGGQLVANWIEQVEPTWQFHVVNDSSNVPYGDKSADEVITLTETAIAPLLNHCDVVVIACNTATALAIDTLRQLHPDTKFVGFEPMIKPASKVSSKVTNLATSTGLNNSRIAVLATPATLKSKRYQDLKAKWASNFQVFEPDCSWWARKIEDNKFSAVDLNEVLTLIEQQQIDQVILACTHYLGIQQLLEQQIAQKVSHSVRILQPMPAIHRQILRMMSP